MVGLDNVADLQRLGLERFHCTYVCTYVIYVYTYITLIPTTLKHRLLFLFHCL